MDVDEWDRITDPDSSSDVMPERPRRTNVTTGSRRLLEDDGEPTRSPRATFFFEKPLGRWIDQAACANEDPTIFDNERSRKDEARAICRSCPVRVACETEGSALPGTWGGVYLPEGSPDQGLGIDRLLRAKRRVDAARYIPDRHRIHTEIRNEYERKKNAKYLRDARPSSVGVNSFNPLAG